MKTTPIKKIEKRGNLEPLELQGPSKFLPTQRRSRDCLVIHSTTSGLLQPKIDWKDRASTIWPGTSSKHRRHFGSLDQVCEHTTATPVHLHLPGNKNPALKQSKVLMEKGHWRLQPLYRPNQPSGKTWADHYIYSALCDYKEAEQMVHHILQDCSLWQQQTPVMAARWVNHQQASENGRRPALHHPIPGSMWTEGLNTAHRLQKKKWSITLLPLFNNCHSKVNSGPSMWAASTSYQSSFWSNEKYAKKWSQQIMLFPDLVTLCQGQSHWKGIKWLRSIMLISMTGMKEFGWKRLSCKKKTDNWPAEYNWLQKSTGNSCDSTTVSESYYYHNARNVK